MANRLFLKSIAGGLGVVSTLAAHATIVDFSSAPLNVTGPSTYVAAGARRDLTATDNSVMISGGTVLSQETFLPANSTTLYGTAFFGPTIPSGNPYLPTVTLDFAAPITNFFLDVYNGQVFNVTYTVADNAGHAASFLLAPNLSSGTTQIGFAAAGNQITITSDAGPVWDFSIDNIHFNETLPTTITNYTVPPVIPPVSSPDVPPVTLVYQGPPPSPPEVTLAEALQRERHRIGADGQGRDLITPAVVGDGRTDLLDQRRAGDFDRHARHDSAGGVADGARDAANLGVRHIRQEQDCGEQ